MENAQYAQPQLGIENDDSRLSGLEKTNLFNAAVQRLGEKGNVTRQIARLFVQMRRESLGRSEIAKFPCEGKHEGLIQPLSISGLK